MFPEVREYEKLKLERHLPEEGVPPEIEDLGRQIVDDPGR